MTLNLNIAHTDYERNQKHDDDDDGHDSTHCYLGEHNAVGFTACFQSVTNSYSLCAVPKEKINLKKNLCLRFSIHKDGICELAIFQLD